MHLHSMSDPKIYPVTVRFYPHKKAEIDLFRKLTDSADDNNRNLNDEIKHVLKSYYAKGKK